MPTEGAALQIKGLDKRNGIRAGGALPSADPHCVCVVDLNFLTAFRCGKA